MSKVENLSLHPSPWTDEGRGEGGGAYRQAIGANAAAGKTEEDEEGGKDTDSGVELKKLTAPVIEERDEERGRNELRAKHMGAAMERERKREREEAREKEEAYQVSTDDSALRLAMDSMHFRRGKPLQKVQEADNELELELQRERELTMDLGAKNRTESGEVETTAVVAAKSRGRSGEAGKESVPLIREISDENGDGSGDGIGGELQGNNKHAEARPPLDRNPVHRNQSPDGPGVEAVSVTSSPIFASLQARAETVLASAASVLQPSSSSIFPSSPSARVPATESSHRLHQQHRLSPAVQDLFSFTASTSPITSIIATAAAAKRVAGVSGRSGGGSESSSIKNRVDLDASKRAGRQKVVRKSTFVGTSIQRRARAKVRRSSRVKGRKNNHANTNTNRTAKRKQSKGKGKGHKKDQGKRRGKKRLSLVTSFNAEQSRIDSNPAESSGVSQAHPQSYTAPHSLGFQALPDGSVDLNTHLDPKLNSMPRFIAPAPASAFASAWDSRDHTGAGTSMATSQPLHHQQQQQQQLHRYHPVYGQQQQHSEASRVSASPSPQAYQSQFASIVSDALRSRSYSGVGVGSHEYHLRQMHQYYASMAATEQPRKQEVLQRAIAQLPQDLRRLHQQHQQHQPHRYNADAGSSSSDFSRPYANDMHSNINARGGGDDDDGGGSSGVGVSAGEDGGNMDGTMSERRTTAGKAAEVKVTELDHTYVPFWEKMGKQREEEREGDLEVAGPTSSALVPVPEPVPDSASALASTSKSSVRSLSHIFRPSSARHWTNTATATELAATSTAHHYHHLHHQQLQYHQRYVGDAPVQVMTPFQHREGDQN